MTLSKSDPSVSWRLNELIEAGHKAKEFATADWYRHDEPVRDHGFELWAPKVIGGPVEDIAEEAPLENAIETVQAAEPELAAEPATAEESAPQIDQEALEQACSDSFDQGYQQAMEAAELKWAEARKGFIDLTDALNKAQSAPNEFFMPLKKLALHIAEQLVRGELTLSTAALERLVDEAINDIEQQGEGPIVVFLNPLDHARFTAHLRSELDHIDLRVDASLLQGSVRVTMDDSATEDLIENRLTAIADSLLGLNGLTKKSSSGARSTKDKINQKRDSIIEGSAELVNSFDPVNSPEPTDSPEPIEGPEPLEGELENGASFDDNSEEPELDA
jgi:flagellar biosynthesis/type III secretory pathway protein FliH